MDIEKFRTFEAVARLGSYTKAADELYLTTAAASKHISQLEKEFGMKLLERGRSGVTLTNEGEKCLEYAGRIVELYDEMQQSLRGYSELHLLCAPNSSRVLEWINSFEESHPDIKVQIKECHGETVIQDVVEGRAEIGAAGLFGKHPELDSVKLFADSMMVMVSVKSDLADRDILSVKDLSNRRFCLMAKGTGLQTGVLQFLEQHGIYPNVDETVTREDTMISEVARKNLVTLIPEVAVRAFSTTDVRLIPLEEELEVGFHVFKKKGGNLKSSAKIFWEFLNRKVLLNKADIEKP